MSQFVPILKGRVAQVKKANNAASIEKNSWSVVASDGLYTADTTRQSSSVHKSKLCDLYFFTTKEEAWEHSAYILSDGQQEQEADTAARISRSLGGLKTLSIVVMGNMSIGRVAGEYNTAGTRAGGAPAATEAPREASQVQLAMAALASLKPTLVGARIVDFPVTVPGAGGAHGGAKRFRAAEIIDELEKQFEDKMSDLQGVRLVANNVYICLSRKESLQQLTTYGFYVRGVSVKVS